MVVPSISFVSRYRTFIITQLCRCLRVSGREISQQQHTRANTLHYRTEAMHWLLEVSIVISLGTEEVFRPKVGPTPAPVHILVSCTSEAVNVHPATRSCPCIFAPEVRRSQNDPKAYSRSLLELPD